MPTQPYKTKDGLRVPGTTTIIGRFKDSGGLIHWAYTEGKEGRDYRATKQTAADAGTCAHAMIEADIRGEVFNAAPFDADAMGKGSQAFKAYLDWKAQAQVTPVQSEVALVSEKYRYGGTLDAVLRTGAALALGDWKTSNALYADNLIQLAAYKNLWDENYPDQPITGGFHLLRFSKTDADFEHRFFAELDAAWRSFVLMRELYDLDAALKRRMK